MKPSRKDKPVSEKEAGEEKEKPVENRTEQKETGPGKQKKDKETEKEPDVKAIDLDEDIRNDIFKTEVNPHVQKRGPLVKDKEELNRERGLNEDTRIVNEQEDDKQKDKYQGL
jgi:hypothetical protein